MFFKEVELSQFRNYEKQHVFFHEKVNIITGNNAQGKTNLLESLYIMCLSKSFRTNKDNEMIRFGQQQARVRSVVFKKERDFETEIILDEGGKTIKIDGLKAEKKSDLFSRIHVVVFSPEDLKIVKDEPEKRRRFIDRELCQIKPLYYKNLSRYKKILLQRNNIMKSDEVDKNVLAAWDHELILYGAKIMLERRKFIEKLNDVSRKIHREISNGKEELSVEYESNIPPGEDLQSQKEEFEGALQRTLQSDIAKRTTAKGPHKDDLKIKVNEVDIRHFGSQGQQRTAALSLKLAEIQLIEEETGDSPVLLLDDVLSELDQTRQTFLIQSLREVQLFLTTTEINPDVRDRLADYKLFIVKESQIVSHETLQGMSAN